MAEEKQITIPPSIVLTFHQYDNILLYLDFLNRIKGGLHEG